MDDADGDTLVMGMISASSAAAVLIVAASAIANTIAVYSCMTDLWPKKQSF